MSERHRIVTTTHLRRRAEEAHRLADEDNAAGRTLLAIAREVVANELLALANEVDSGGEPRVSIAGDEEQA